MFDEGWESGSTICISFGADWWPRSTERFEGAVSVDCDCDGAMLPLATTVSLGTSFVCSILPLNSNTVAVCECERLRGDGRRPTCGDAPVTGEWRRGGPAEFGALGISDCWRRCFQLRDGERKLVLTHNCRAGLGIYPWLRFVRHYILISIVGNVVHRIRFRSSKLFIL